MRKNVHIPLQLLVSALFLLFLGGCKKEKASYPIVEILTPKSGSFFSVPDTIPIRVRVADKDLSSVTVTLVDANFQPAGETVPIAVRNTDFTFDVNYPITDVRLNSGSYHIRVIASNSVNTTRSFSDIGINGIPRRSRGWVVASNSGASPAEIVFIDSLGGQNTELPFSGPVSKLVVSSRQRRYLISPMLVQSFSMRSTGDHMESASHSFLHPLDPPVIRSSDGDGMAVFAASADGRMFAFNEFGHSSTYPLETGYEPIAMRVHPDGILLASLKRNPSQYRLFWIRRTNGFVFSDAIITMEPVAICRGEGDVFFVFTNDAGTGRIHRYTPGDALTNVLTQPQLPEIRTAVRVGPDQFVISTTAGLYYYQYNPGNHFTLTGIAGNILRFDEERSVLLSAEAGTLFTYQWPSMQPGSTYSIGDSIAGLDVIYNK